MKSSKRFELRGRSTPAPEPKKPTMQLSVDVKLKQLEAAAEALGFPAEFLSQLGGAMREDMEQSFVDRALAEAEAEAALEEEEGDEPVYSPDPRAAPPYRRGPILGSPEPRTPTREYQELRDFRGGVIQRVVTRVIPPANADRVHYHYIGGPEHGRQVTVAMRRHDTIRTSVSLRRETMQQVGSSQDRIIAEYHLYHRRDYCLHGEFIVVFVSQDLRDEDIPQYVEEMAAI